MIHDDPHWAFGYDQLVRALLEAEHSKEAQRIADEAAQKVARTPEGQTALGRMAYRRGDITAADKFYRAALKLNPNYPGALRGLAALFRCVAKFKTAERLELAAYKVSMEDPESIQSWAGTLHGAEHIAALGKALAIYDPETKEARNLRAHIAADKAIGDRKTRILTSAYERSEIKLDTITDGPNRRMGIGIRVQLNGGPTFKLMLDCGASGLLLSPKAAKKAGLEALEAEGREAHGMGDKTPDSEYGYLASEAAFGGVTFSNYPVGIFKSAKSANYDGLAGLDIFRNFLVTVDFTSARLTLEPFDKSNHADVEGPLDAGDNLADGFHKIFRFGHMLTTPTSINGEAPRLFIIDSGSNANLIDTQAAKDSTKVSSDDRTRVRGIQGEVKSVSRADRVVLTFAGFKQENPGLIAVDFEKNSDRLGVAISGIIGMPVLWQMAMTVDYRNAAVRFQHKMH